MDKFVSYRVCEITGLALSLQIKGKLPDDLGLSLGHLVEYFGIVVPGNHHEAKYDTRATMLVWQKLMDLM